MGFEYTSNKITPIDVEIIRNIICIGDIKPILL